jgi:oligopeptide/dipeptide ABC transporter ATP-binding protein
VSVIYAGRIVESGATREDVLGRPRHPYTRALLDALPHPEGSADRELVAIAGTPPTPAGRPAGCAFHPRCALRAVELRTSTCRSSSRSAKAG